MKNLIGGYIWAGVLNDFCEDEEEYDIKKEYDIKILKWLNIGYANDNLQNGRNGIMFAFCQDKKSGSAYWFRTDQEIYVINDDYYEILDTIYDKGWEKVKESSDLIRYFTIEIDKPIPNEILQ